VYLSNRNLTKLPIFQQKTREKFKKVIVFEAMQNIFFNKKAGGFILRGQYFQ
jgi:hypothetical protein